MREAESGTNSHGIDRQVSNSMLLVVIGALILLSVTYINGRPTVFADTEMYYSEAFGAVSTAADKFLHHTRARGAAGAPEVTARAANTRRWPEKAKMHNIAGGRSFFYGILLLISQYAHSIWICAIIQAVVTTAIFLDFWKLTTSKLAPLAFLGAMAVLAVATPLPLIVGFMMPDVFAGLAILVVVMLMTRGGKMSKGHEYVLICFLAYCLVVHQSHILLALIIFCFAFLYRRSLGISRRTILRMGVAFGAAALLSIGLNAAYSFAVEKQTGDALRSPPFLVARVLADGPGRRYLASVCSSEKSAPPPYVLCEFRYLPLDNAQEMLWSNNPHRGLLAAADYDSEVQIKSQETEFVIAAVSHYPVEQIAASGRNFFGQLLDISLSEVLLNQFYYLTDSHWSQTRLPILVNGAGRCVSWESCATLLTAGSSVAVYWVAVGLALLFVVGAVSYCWWFADGKRLDQKNAVLTALPPILLVLCGVVANAAVCGILSEPTGRYQARVIWLVPAMAVLLVELLFGEGGASLPKDNGRSPGAKPLPARKETFILGQ
jgi:hypothetical protein